MENHLVRRVALYLISKPADPLHRSLYIFDKDGTLVKRLRRYGVVKYSLLKPEDQISIPGVFEKLAQLRAEGHQLLTTCSPKSY